MKVQAEIEKNKATGIPCLWAAVMAAGTNPSDTMQVTWGTAADAVSLSLASNSLNGASKFFLQASKIACVSCVANCQHLQICQPFSNHHDFLLVVVGWHLLGCTWVAAKTLLCCINRNESSAKREQESASVQKKKIVQLWEWTSVDLSETLGFVGLYWVELSVCIIPPIIYNLLPPWTYPVLGNHVNLLVLCFLCVCFRSSMHNKLVSEH